MILILWCVNVRGMVISVSDVFYNEEKASNNYWDM
jgi:hypothetical protein